MIGDAMNETAVVILSKTKKMIVEDSLKQHIVEVAIPGSFTTVAMAFIQESIIHMIPWLIVTCAVILCDLAFGIRCSLMLGEKVRFSSAARRSCRPSQGQLPPVPRRALQAESRDRSRLPSSRGGVIQKAPAMFCITGAYFVFFKCLYQ